MSPVERSILCQVSGAVHGKPGHAETKNFRQAVLDRGDDAVLAALKDPSADPGAAVKLYFATLRVERAALTTVRLK